MKGQKRFRKPWLGFFFVLFSLPLFESAALAQVEFLPVLSISEQYTDNFSFTKSNKKYELTTRISPGVAVLLNTPALVLTARYLGGVELYVNNKDNNRYRHRLAFDMDLPFLSHASHYYEVHVTEVLEYSPTLSSIPLSDSDKDRPEAPIGRTKTFRNRAGIRMDYKGFPFWRTSFTYFNTETRYIDSFLEDFVVHDARLLQTVRLSPHANLSASYGILNTDFERANPFTAQSISLGGERVFRSALSLRGVGGVSWMTSVKPSLVSEIGLSKKFRFTALGIDYSKSIGAGEDVLASAVSRERFAIRVVHPITLKTRFKVGLEQMERTVLLDPATGSTSYGVTTGITTQFFRWLTGSIRYTYFNYNGRGADTQDADRNTIDFLLSAFPPDPRAAPLE